MHATWMHNINNLEFFRAVFKLRVDLSRALEHCLMHP